MRTLWRIGKTLSNHLEGLLPKMANEKASLEDLTDVLHDMGDELRHILYHIRDARYFGYLLDGRD